MEVEWSVGSQFAYITYSDVNSAENAANQMRGYRFGNDESMQIRVDFADAASPPHTSYLQKLPSATFESIYGKAEEVRQVNEQQGKIRLWDTIKS